MAFLLHDLLDDRAAATPERPAAAFLDKALSYGELSARSDRLAEILAEGGVERHARVGIYMDKSIETPVALYGIMKAGAAYVPLDPAAPAERIAGIVADCGIRHLVSAPGKLRKLRALAKLGVEFDRVVGIDDDAALPWNVCPWQALDAAPTSRPSGTRSLESDLAYIIYTSGSTGTPKGIMHTHHSGLSFARWAVREYALTETDRLSNHAPLHFDLSIFDYFAAVVAGAATVIIPEAHTKLASSYTQILQDHRVTVLFTVPFALIQMLKRGSLDDRDLSSLRWAIFGGEPFPPAYLRELVARLPHVRFDNMYGPAEVNGCTHFTIEDVDDAGVPIGPIADCAEALIVDTDDRPVSRGAIGELLVRTPTMMQGYWQRDDLNARAFFRRENAAGLEEVFYRTGDLVQSHDDDVLRFVGRKDRQVKVRGYRVELDEIEIALTNIDGIEEGAVYLVDDGEGSQRIVAEVTLDEGAELAQEGIGKQLKATLPAYALPASIQIATCFPRTQTGKIDRRKLRDIAMQRLAGTDGDGALRSA